jgi:AcrR family transcriptional regulator
MRGTQIHARVPAVTVDHAQDLGLRERKKLATREALSLAAVRLALERGLENVRVDDIAAAAGVSPRTYNNYFSSREEAICAAAAERARQLGAALRARPPDEPLGEAIILAVGGGYAHGEPDKNMIRLIVSTPALRGEFLKTVAAREAQLAEAIAERTGLDAENDLEPRLLAAVVSGASRIATIHWLRPDVDAPYARVVERALRLVVPPAAEAVSNRSYAPARAPTC